MFTYSDHPHNCGCMLKAAPRPPVKVYVLKHEKAVAKAVAKVLEAQAKAVVKALEALTKADIPPEVATILEELETLGFSVTLSEALMQGILEAFAAGAVSGLGLVGLQDDESIVNQLDENALQFAKQRSAELVGMTWSADGLLVPNPSPMWSITETTRKGLQALITKAVTDGASTADLAKEVRDSYWFSKSRSETIARTELAFAHTQGNIKGWEETGVVAGKKSLLADTHPEIDVCNTNADVGAIPLKTNFPSGHSGPPYHPNCLCALVPVLEDEMNQFVVEEDPRKAKRREEAGLTELVTVNARAFQNRFEADNQEPLPWTEGAKDRRVKLRELKSVDAYPEVGMNARGLLSVSDGRHRIAVAAERGQNITVAMRPADAKAFRKRMSKVDLSVLRKAAVDDAAHGAATTTLTPLLPSAASLSSGNYRKGHIRVSGLDISIENPEGSSRKPGWPPLTAHYGYVKGTTGADGDHVDIFVKPQTPVDYSGPVFVVDQHIDGKFDEHKCLLGWATEKDARTAYGSNYQPGWKGLKAITEMSLEDFKSWLSNGDTTAPVKES